METLVKYGSLARIPAGVWQEFVSAVKREGMTVQLWNAYAQLPFLFSLSPEQAEVYMAEKAGTCKTL